MSSTIQRKDLNDDEFQAVYIYLPQNTSKSKLRRGAIRDASIKFGISQSTVGHIRNKSTTAGDLTSVVRSLEQK